MGQPELRIAAVSHRATGGAAEPTVRLRLGEIVPLLVRATVHDHAWVRDLADDVVIVTPDLAQVLHTYATLEQTKRGA